MSTLPRRLCSTRSIYRRVGETILALARRHTGRRDSFAAELADSSNGVPDAALGCGRPPATSPRNDRAVRVARRRGNERGAQAGATRTGSRAPGRTRPFDLGLSRPQGVRATRTAVEQKAPRACRSSEEWPLWGPGLRRRAVCEIDQHPAEEGVARSQFAPRNSIDDRPPVTRGVRRCTVNCAPPALWLSAPLYCLVDNSNGLNLDQCVRRIQGRHLDDRVGRIRGREMATP